MTNPHPNATAAGGASATAVGVVWVLGHFGVDISAEAGAFLAGTLSTVVLFVGRNGIGGTWQRIWHGSG